MPLRIGTLDTSEKRIFNKIQLTRNCYTGLVILIINYGHCFQVATVKASQLLSTPKWYGKRYGHCLQVMTVKASKLLALQNRMVKGMVIVSKLRQCLLINC